MKKFKAELPAEFRYNLPVLELTGNRQASVEGSTGVLKYEDEVVRINTCSMVISFEGRGLRLKCITPVSVVVEGFINKVEFLT